VSMETLRKEIQELESDIEELEEKIKAKTYNKATALARGQARIFLARIFAPYMDGLCDTWGVSPEEGLRILITQNISLDKIANDNPEALDEFLSQPEFKVITSVTKPLGNVSDEWIKDKMTVLLEAMEDIRPELARGIIETPGGQTWFYESLIGLRDTLFGKPQLKYEG